MSKFLLFTVLATSAFAAGPPKLRLPDDVVPVRYHLDLTVIPEQDHFAGKIEIELDVRKTADTVWLNARNRSDEPASFLS